MNYNFFFIRSSFCSCALVSHRSPFFFCAKILLSSHFQSIHLDFFLFFRFVFCLFVCHASDFCCPYTYAIINIYFLFGCHHYIAMFKHFSFVRQLQRPKPKYSNGNLFLFFFHLFFSLFSISS